MKKKRFICLLSVVLLLSMFAAPWACCTPAPDPLSLLAITATTGTDTSVTISWATDRDATAQVLYGTTTGDLDLSTDATTALTKEHSFP